MVCSWSKITTKLQLRYPHLITPPQSWSPSLEQLSAGQCSNHNSRSSENPYAMESVHCPRRINFRNRWLTNEIKLDIFFSRSMWPWIEHSEGAGRMQENDKTSARWKICTSCCYYCCCSNERRHSKFFFLFLHSNRKDCSLFLLQVVLKMPWLVQTCWEHRIWFPFFSMPTQQRATKWW